MQGNNTENFPKALTAPAKNDTVITVEHINLVCSQSRISPRKRILLPFHKDPQSSLHRMLNGMQPGTYIRPHRHLAPPKAETVIVLKGAICVVIFQPEGEIKAAHVLTAGGEQFGMDSEPGIFHTFLVLSEDTVLFEVKPGPYSEASDKDFAPWAPAEYSAKAEEYLHQLFFRVSKYLGKQLAP